MRKVKSFEELTENGGEFVDCYVSTDAGEAAAILEGIGFRTTTGESALAEIYNGDVLRNRRDCRVDCVNIPQEEADKRRTEMGVPYQAKLRIYTNGSGDPEKVLLPILQVFDARRQDVGFVNSNYTRMFTKNWSR